jgi:uncharacterized protein (TIGR02246 family)
LGLVIVGLLALSAVVGAFAATAAPSQAATKATLSKNLKGYMAAWNAHDPAKAAGYFAKNGSFLDSTVGTPVVGRENIKNDVIGYFINACPDCKWTRSVAKTIIGKNKVSFVWTYTGTNTGAWGSGSTALPATNKPFEFSGCTFMQFTAAGKILHQYDYYDALGFSKQLGWL